MTKINRIGEKIFTETLGFDDSSKIIMNTINILANVCIVLGYNCLALISQWRMFIFEN